MNTEEEAVRRTVDGKFCITVRGEEWVACVRAQYTKGSTHTHIYTHTHTHIHTSPGKGT